MFDKRKCEREVQHGTLQNGSYRRNTALLELRKKQLLAAKRHAKQYEVKYRLMRRIRMLNEMINESRLAAFEMENYYEKEGEYVGRTAV